MLSNPRPSGFTDVTSKPRVLIFSLAYFPWVGGAEIAVKEITDRLGSPTQTPTVSSELGQSPDLLGSVGVNFDLITLKLSHGVVDREVMGNVNVYRVGGGKLFFPIRAFLLAKKLHRRHPYQVIWSVMAAYAGFAALFFKLFKPRIPFLLTLQEGDSEKHILNRVGIFYPLWRLIFKKADYIQAISNYLADFARRYGAECPVEVIPNGVSLDKFEIRSAKSETNPKSQNSNIKRVITTSRLVYKNGIDTLIRAIKLLTTNYKLLIVGDGPDRSKLEQLTIDLGVADKIKFVGHVLPDEIPGYLAQADIFVRPSRSEGLGNSFLEAMAAGLPVIGTPVGGIPDFLRDEETGLFCRLDDPEDLADKINLVLSDQNLYRKLSENGRKLVESDYSWNEIALKMRGIFDSLYPKPYTPNPHILLATGIYPPEIGGPATYAALLEKELPSKSIEVTVLPFRTVRNWPKGLAHLFYFIKAFRLCLKNNAVLAQDTISVGLPSLLAAKLTGRKFVIRVPGDYVWEQSVQRFGVKDSIDDFQKKHYGWTVEFLRSVQKFVVNQADVVITPSRYFRQLVSGWVKDPSKVRVIYNGIDLKVSNSPACAEASAGRQFLTPKESLRDPTGQVSKQITKSKILISAGRLVPWKGFEFLIGLMRDLPEWKLMIAGDGPEREALKLQITNYKLQNRVELLGQIPRDELFKQMSQAEIFVLNTSFESFSFQIVEAMALGLPVVATKIGNLDEIIDDGVNGFLVEPDNKGQFLEIIKKIDADDDLRQRVSKAAMAKAGQFSIENTLNHLVSMLQTL